MANRSNEPSGYAKQKLFFLREMFAEHTDADHGITMKEIQDKVERQYGIRPDHKTIISDINALESCQVEIQRAAGRRKDYGHYDKHLPLFPLAFVKERGVFVCTFLMLSLSAVLIV